MSETREYCYFCPLWMTNRLEVYQHCNLHHADLISDKWLPCNDCNNYYPGIQDLEVHQQMVHNVGISTRDDRVNCAYCPADFGDKAEYYIHAREQHQEVVSNEWVSCEYCFLQFPSSKAIKSHRNQVHSDKVDRSHKSDKNLMCQFCPKTFRKFKVYIRHANSHHQPQVSDTWLACAKCDVFYPDEQSLNHHKDKSRCTKVKDEEVEVVDGEASTTSETFRCHFCPTQFSRSSIMFKHANSEHFESVSREWLPCETCRIFFPTPVALTNHTISAHQDKKEMNIADKILCSFCPHTSRNTSDYYKHANRHHLDLISLEWMPCETCNLFFPSQAVLHNHVSVSHNTTPPAGPSKRFKCDFCPQTFVDSTRYYNHANQDHLEEVSALWYKCEECSKHFPSQEKLKIHSGIMHSQQQKTRSSRSQLSNLEGICCQFCPKAFKKSSGYYFHANTMHKEQVTKDWVACGICEDFLPSWKVLKKHRENSHANNIGQIEDNDESFNENLDSELDSKTSGDNSMSKHDDDDDVYIKMESTNDGYFHDFGSGGLPLKVNLKEESESNDKGHEESSDDGSSEEVVMDMDPNEIKREMDEDYSEEDDDDSGAEDRDEPITVDLNGSKSFTCPKCGKTFGRMEFLKRHILRIHTVTVKVDCDICGKSFKRMETLHKHKRSVHLKLNRHQCGLCEKHFADNFALTQHVKSVHANIKYDCELCGKSFTSKGYIKRHTDLVHLKNRNFDCSHCGQAFSENHVLKRHILAVHLKHRNFECDKCGQTFSENHVLKRHIQSVHLKQRNHECEHCGRSFSESHVLKRHIQSVHLKQRNYNCDKCGQTFSENHVLKRHMLAVHAGQMGPEMPGEHGGGGVPGVNLTGVHVDEHTGLLQTEQHV